MRVINVIVIKDNALYDIQSFGVFEEQLSQEVVEKAEKAFVHNALKLTGMREEDFNDTFGDMDCFIEDGIFANSTYYSVCLTWSEI